MSMLVLIDLGNVADMMVDGVASDKPLVLQLIPSTTRPFVLKLVPDGI